MRFGQVLSGKMTFESVGFWEKIKAHETIPYRYNKRSVIPFWYNIRMHGDIPFWYNIRSILYQLVYYTDISFDKMTECQNVPILGLKAEVSPG